MMSFSDYRDLMRPSPENLLHYNDHNSLHPHDTAHLCTRASEHQSIRAPLICSVSVTTRAERGVNLKCSLDAQVEAQQSDSVVVSLAHTSGLCNVLFFKS